ncbi:MAG: response regulator [Crocinitomicaceae bacterium]|nr:response regulator [Crocinitomicaceae bacterium]
MKKILVIEDNEEIRDNTSEVLELHDYEVISAPDGRDGIFMMEQNEVDLILCDILMPNMTGYDVLHAAKQSEKTKSIPFVFMSASVEPKEIEEARKRGIEFFITKPFQIEKLLDTIEKALS